MFFWLTSPALSKFWDDANYALGVAVAASVFGESIVHLVPPNRIPKWFRSASALSQIGWWSTLILVVALALEVPVSVARETIAEAAVGNLQNRLTLATRTSRLFTNKDDAIKFAAMLSKFSGDKYGMVIESAERNPNSEQALFGSQLRKLLNAAGWLHSTNPLMQQFWSENSDRGILIGYRADSKYSQTALNDLIADFATFGIQSSGDPYSDMDEHTFFFEIGIR
jgi:hypothetical protein